MHFALVLFQYAGSTVVNMHRDINFQTGIPSQLRTVNIVYFTDKCQSLSLQDKQYTHQDAKYLHMLETHMQPHDMCLRIRNRKNHS